MELIWDRVLNEYVHSLISPDGRSTFESTPNLVRAVLDNAKIKKNDVVVDVGCGWGNITIPCSKQTRQAVIGIEPDLDNINEARKRSTGYNIKYIEGAFEKLNYTGEADVVISSLAFHQVSQQYRATAIKNIESLLKKTGKFVLCDTIIMFDPKANPELFDKVYRYLLEKTVPQDIFTTQIAPYLQNDHIYTWEEMKEYTPEDSWFYSENDLRKWASESNMQILEAKEFCPFFGIVVIGKMVSTVIKRN